MRGYDELFNTRQAAAFLGVGELTVRLAVKEGKLRAWRLPNQRDVLIRKRDLLPFREPGHELLGPRQLSLFGDGGEAA
ncbi:MAG TPA: excisionase family DNA-binding protein [Chloroflexia bacterium]|nr:excisionase family DNA-binding protein [Chloroflexia bacterium]